MNYFAMKLREKNKGFSLIELVVVLFITAILSQIGFVAFNRYLRRAKSFSARESIRKIKSECISNAELGLKKDFTLFNLNSYSIKTRDKNSCLGEIKNGLITALPDNPDYLPTYSYSDKSGEINCTYNGFIKGLFNECESLKSKFEKYDFVVKDSYREKGCFAYVLVDGPTWSVAEASANKLGGHLATIPDAEDNKWMFSNYEGGNWIGLIKKDGDWEWINGEKVDYKNWYPGQPSNSIHPRNSTIQSYGWIHSDWSGKWDDHFDSNDLGTKVTHGIAQIPICD